MVSGCYSPVLLCIRCLGPFRSLFSAWKYKKKGAALLSRAYRLVQGYRPRFLQSLYQCLRRLFEIYPVFSHVFTVPLPNRSRLKVKKNVKGRQEHSQQVCKRSGSYLSKMTYFLDFCAVSVQISRLRNVITTTHVKYTFCGGKKVTPGTRRVYFVLLLRVNTAVYFMRTHLYLVRITRKTRVTLSECQTQW